MDIGRLHGYVMQEFAQLRVPMDGAFDTIRQRVAKHKGITIMTAAKWLSQAGADSQIKCTVTNRKESDSAGTFYYPSLSAQCFAPRKGKTPRIEMLMWQHPSATKCLTAPWVVDYFQYRFYKMVQHELVHRAQYVLSGSRREKVLIFKPASAKGDKFHAQQQYLGEIDEIEAYAHDVVEEWYYLHPDTPLTPEALIEEYRGQKRLSTVCYYAMVFNQDEKHPAVLRFFNKVLQWNEVMTPMAHSLPPAHRQITKTRKTPLLLE